jgi:hypothetical protein
MFIESWLDETGYRESRGAVSGVTLVLLGLGGGLVPFVEPYFGYAFILGRTLGYTPGRLWLEVLPARGVIVSSLLVVVTRSRLIVLAGGVPGAVSATYFIVGAIAVLAAAWVRATSWTVSHGPRTRVDRPCSSDEWLSLRRRYRAANRPIRDSQLLRRSERDGPLAGIHQLKIASIAQLSLRKRATQYGS